MQLGIKLFADWIGQLPIPCNEVVDLADSLQALSLRSAFYLTFAMGLH